MLQLLQNLGNGATEVVDVPAPGPRCGALLIRSRLSLVSAGTERMLVDFGKAGLIGKVLRQPERVREVWAKVRANGVSATVEAVRSKLAQPIPLGYCNVGQVVAAGAPAFAAGDRVISNGSHAEVISVDARLCTRIPEGVDDAAAAFAPLAAIALQGIHLLDAKLGDKVVVTGLGLIGQLAVRLLRARGCEVLGLDPSPERRQMARAHGAHVPDVADPVAAALSWTKGLGVAAVLITASTVSHLPVSQAARACGRRGRVVLVGVVGLNLNRADFYRNEVSFQVSCSYGARDHTGPGSVRANFDEVLGHMATGRLAVGDLVTQEFPFARATSAYGRLTADKCALGLLLRYGADPSFSRTAELGAGGLPGQGMALVGAGNFAARTLLPALRRTPKPPVIRWVASNQGHHALLTARAFGAAAATTDIALPMEDAGCRAIFVCTRHDAHAGQAVSALRAGKSVWVEKPLALTLADLDEIGAAATASPGCLMVGFNRRFAPAATRLLRALGGKEGSLRLEMTVNAGRLDSDHWTLDPKTGGGRIVGEACHFVDLARYFVRRPIASIRCLRRDTDGQDGGCFELAFADGSVAKIDYRTDLPPEVPKEVIGVVGDGFSATIHNWARLTSSGLPGASLGWPWSRAPRKGHPEALAAYLAATEGKGPSPIPLEEILEVSRAAIRMQAMEEGDEFAPGTLS
jgi:predicted dehydrogenase